MKAPVFQARVAELRRERRQAITGRLLADVPDALAVVRAVMAGAERPAAQLAAARILLATAERYQNSEDFDSRLAEIERRLADQEAEVQG